MYICVESKDTPNFMGKLVLIPTSFIASWMGQKNAKKSYSNYS